MADYIVTAPLVIAKAIDGSDVYLYKGAPFPHGLAAGETRRLRDAELIEAIPEIILLPTAEELAAAKQADEDRLAAEKAAAEAKTPPKQPAK